MISSCAYTDNPVDCIHFAQQAKYFGCRDCIVSGLEMRIPLGGFGGLTTPFTSVAIPAK